MAMADARPERERWEANPEVAVFLRQLEEISWFAKIGEPLLATSPFKQIRSWEEWPGPEEFSVEQIGYRQQSLYDELMESGDSAELTRLWEKIHSIVFRDAKHRVPYDEREDAWHGPTTAVWDAAWTAGLVGLHLFLQRPIPADLQQQWTWFAEGHWPCDWDGDIPEGSPIVF
jgi:hypothetical protein